MTPEVEAATIAAARSGSEGAFTELYRVHVPAVRTVVWKILRRQDDDVVQEVFLLAFTRLHQFQEGSRFRTWITRIAINKATQQFRGVRALDRIEGRLEDYEEDEDIRFGCDDAELIRTPIRVDLERAMSQLSPALRRSIEDWLRGLSHDEITGGQSAGETIAASKSRRHQAVVKLCSLLSGRTRISGEKTNVQPIHIHRRRAAQSRIIPTRAWGSGRQSL